MDSVRTTKRGRLGRAVRGRMAKAWRDLMFVTVGLPLQALGWVIIGLPWAYVSLGSTFGVTLELVLPFVVVMFCTAELTCAQRWRFRTVRGVDIPPPPRPEVRRNWQGFRALANSESTWRQILYHLVVGPAIGGAAILVGSAGLIGGAYALASGISMMAAAPIKTLKPFDHMAHAQAIQATITVTGLIFLVVLLTSPWLFGSLARLDTRAALALLGPNRTDELERRVEGLTESREAVVEAADAERRRIERDLHDGAQQRLTSLAMNLGLARATLTDIPEEARQAIEDAHEEAKEAISELRSLVRGLHPAILEDRGLDAALSGVAARSPIPVRLSVDVRARPSAKVEAVAYFIVAEALTNAARYSGATGVDVVVERFGGFLFVAVSDDGVGGANPEHGTGLTGLAQRVASVDGTFEVSSPTGGPTVISAELPCVL
jgi:signal transduction histidine kinase